MDTLNKLFKIRYDLLSELNDNRLINLRYLAVEEKEIKKVLFYNRQIDLLTENLKLLTEINFKIKEERIKYNNYLVKNNRKDFYR